MADRADQPARANPARSRVAMQTYSRGLGLSVTLHAAALLAVLFVHHTPPPAGTVGSVELVLLSPELKSIPAAPPVPEPPEPAAPTDAAPAREAAPEQAQPPEPLESPPPVATVPDREAVPDPPPLPEPVAQAPAKVAEPHPPKPRPVQATRPPIPRPNAADRVPPPRARTAAGPEPSAEPPSAASAPPAPPQPDADPAWLAGVSAWLVRHRSYPEMARTLGRQGTVVIRITVDPDGHVVDANLVRGSGSDSLDHAAETLVRNAQLPPFPPTMRAARQSLTIPIHYRLE